jgi:hypothetical protein
MLPSEVVDKVLIEKTRPMPSSVDGGPKTRSSKSTHGTSSSLSTGRKDQDPLSLSLTSPRRGPSSSSSSSSGKSRRKKGTPSSASPSPRASASSSASSASSSATTSSKSSSSGKEASSSGSKSSRSGSDKPKTPRHDRGIAPRRSTALTLDTTSRLTPAPKSPQQPPSPAAHQWYEALFDFRDPQDRPSMLSFSQGDRVLVLKRMVRLV